MHEPACSVSIIVPSKNRPEEIARMLGSLRSQATQPLEVIVVDQSSPRYDLQAFPGVVHLHEPGLSGLTAARNCGVNLARGEVVVFFDDDVILESDCVSVIGNLFAERIDIVGAQCSVTNPWDSIWISQWLLSRWIFEHGFFDSRPTRRGHDIVPRLIDGLASAYRRTIFETERFDEYLQGYCLAEDWDFTKRATRHGNLIVAEEARVRHVPSPRGRLDAERYLEMRWQNILYLYEKLQGSRDPRNRFWRLWWMLGERLRTLKRCQICRLLR